MEIKMIKVGMLRCNCYILIKEHEAIIIDPGDEPDKIISLIGENKVVGLIITHHHFDHDGAVDDLVRRYKVKVMDRYNLIEGENKIGNFTFKTIYTSGHKEDLITIYFEDEKVMFCGDFIFKDTIGRVDLPESNANDMVESINKIKEYDRDIIIYPGHGVKTTLGYEIDNNIYFNSNISAL